MGESPFVSSSFVKAIHQQGMHHYDMFNAQFAHVTVRSSLGYLRDKAKLMVESLACEQCLVQFWTKWASIESIFPNTETAVHIAVKL